MREVDRDTTASAESLDIPWRLASVCVLLVGSLLLAWFAWASHGEAKTVAGPGDAETHRLSVDQAACLRFGLVTSRSDARLMSVALGSYSTLDPDAARQLRQEVSALDQISGDFPSADYRLVQSVATSADAGALVLARGGIVTFRTVVAQRAQAISETEQLCSQLAGFDTSTLRVTGQG